MIAPSGGGLLPGKPLAPVLDPTTVRITQHALDRYSRRRSNGLPEVGVRRLVERAAERPTPPLRFTADHKPHRRVLAGGFVLIFDADMRTLVTLWRI